MHDRDWYSVLGIPRDASQKEVRDAYMRYARVVHPDRFDSAKQPVEWAHANEMLKEANRAYEVLRDPAKRASYDGDRARAATPPHSARRAPQTDRDTPPRPRARATDPGSSGPGRSNPNPSAGHNPSAGQKKPGPGEGAETGGPSHGWGRFDRLPQDVRDRLLERQRGDVPNQYSVKTEGVFWKVVVALLALGWFWMLFELASDGYRWSGARDFWYPAITIGASMLLGKQLFWIWRWRSAELKCRFYVTPLYFIRTYHDTVHWWPLWKLNDLKVTHNYRNHSYQHTELVLVFPDGKEEVEIRSKAAAETLLDTLRQLDQRMRTAAAQQQWGYFTSNDDFRNAPRKSDGVPWLTKERLAAYGAALFLGVVLFAVANDVNSSRPPLTGAPTQARNDVSGRSSSPPPTRFAEPPRPLPSNGALRRFHSGEGLAPLEIRTRGSSHHYYVKVEDYYTGVLLATVFVQGGRSVELLMPLGTARLKYATGATWYGLNHLFGPDTRYTEAERALVFSDEGYQYSGYTVELFSQPNGNLSTTPIAPNQF